MTTTKVFMSGNSQAVRLPKEFHLDCDRVEIFRRGKEIILREIPENLTTAFEVLSQFPDDFFAQGREDSYPQEREGF